MMTVFFEYLKEAIAIYQVTTNSVTAGVQSGGTIPYFTGRRAVDFLGVNDKYIARQSPDLGGMTTVPGHNKADLKYTIRTLQPTYIQIARWGTQDLSEWVDTSNQSRL